MLGSSQVMNSKVDQIFPFLGADDEVGGLQLPCNPDGRHRKVHARLQSSEGKAQSKVGAHLRYLIETSG